MSVEAVVIGSLNMDLVVRAPRAPSAGETIHATEFRLVPGGKGANQAVAMARLGGRVAMVGRVGADSFGSTLVEGLHQDLVSVSHVHRDPDIPTGVALIIVDDSGQNRIVVYPGANGRLERADVDAAAVLVQQARFLVLQLEIPLEIVAHAIELAVKHGVPVVLNPAPATPLPGRLLAGVDLLVPNETEATILTGIGVVDLHSAEEAGRQLLAQGPRTVIITLGARGALVVAEHGAEHIPAPPVEVVDTTAAGDAFVGGLVVGLVRGLALPAAVHGVGDVARHAGRLLRQDIVKARENLPRAGVVAPGKLFVFADVTVGAVEGSHQRRDIGTLVPPGV